MQILYPKKKFLVLTQKTNFFKKTTTTPTTTITAPWHTQLNKFPPKNFFSQKENFLMPTPEKNFYNFLEKKFST